MLKDGEGLKAHTIMEIRYSRDMFLLTLPIGTMFPATFRLRLAGYPAGVISGFRSRLRFSGYLAGVVSGFRSRIRFPGYLAGVLSGFGPDSGFPAGRPATRFC